MKHKATGAFDYTKLDPSLRQAAQGAQTRSAGGWGEPAGMWLLSGGG